MTFFRVHFEIECKSEEKSTADYQVKTTCKKA